MSKTAKAALWIMAATMFSKVLGFLRELVLANFYGTGMYADVFVLTLNIPGLIIAVIGSAVATTYIPMYFETKKRLGDEGALKFTNNVLNICYIMAIVMVFYLQSNLLQYLQQDLETTLLSSKQQYYLLK